MWKQFLGKLPKKPQKADPDSARTPLSSPVSNRINATAAAASKRASSSAVFPTSLIAGIEPLVSFREVPSSEKMNLFVSKLNLCCVVFDFTDSSKNIQEKDLKRAALLDLLEFVSQNPSKFSEDAVSSTCRMCSVNLFRIFPPRCSVENENEDEPTFDPAWPHLQIVYDLLLKFITSPSVEAKVAKKYIDNFFISRIIDLFDSEDPRERDCLKAILHRIYGKFMIHRPFIRKSISNVFYRFVFETQKHNGISELLEILGSVITGFALPLKDEHRIFLSRALMPLHKAKSLGVYSQQLSYCVNQFVQKEPELIQVVIAGLLRYWPATNSQKEVMFLGEMEEILEGTHVNEFRKLMVPVFRRVACCITSHHFQVAERALFLWNNNRIANLIAENRQVILPIIFPALEANAEHHWNQAVVNLTLNVKKMVVEMDEELAVSCLSKYREEQNYNKTVAEKRNEMWEIIENN
ncbi:hypothetical protein M569_04647, partial [Genlisea aurea]